MIFKLSTKCGAYTEQEMDEYREIYRQFDLYFKKFGSNGCYFVEPTDIEIKSLKDICNIIEKCGQIIMSKDTIEIDNGLGDYW